MREDELPLRKQLELMRGLRTVHFSRGQVVYKEGDLSDSLYFMLGRTEVRGEEQGASEGAELTLETRGGGDGDRDRNGDEDMRIWFPFIPATRYFGEEGLVYRRVRAEDLCRKSGATSFPLHRRSASATQAEVTHLYHSLHEETGSLCFSFSSVCPCFLGQIRVSNVFRQTTVVQQDSSRKPTVNNQELTTNNWPTTTNTARNTGGAPRCERQWICAWQSWTGPRSLFGRTFDSTC